MVFVCYPKCTTCQKAKRWLDSKGISYEERNIKEEKPTADELRQWVAASGLRARKFFNTSGLLYRSMNLKEKLDAGMSEEEQIQLLATDGMLVKRPILVTENQIFVGFQEDKWRGLLK